jgi:hypothetical protein
MTLLHQTRNSATESIPAALRPLQATVGSNTEIGDDCWPAIFHRGAFGVKTPFFNPTIAEGVKLLVGKSGDVVETKRTINFREA